MPSDMTCAECRDLLSAHIDGELDADRALAVAQHLASCTSCSADHETMLETIRTARAALPPLRAPETLKARIQANVAREAAPSARTIRGRQWMFATAIAAVALLAFFTGRRGAPRGPASMEDQVLTAHLRSLQLGHLTDVASTDRHTVKPWFAGKLDFSPTVIALDSVGFPLVGGRLEYVGGRAVAALVYGRRLHTINVITWPAESASEVAPHLVSKNGYNVANWTARGMTYWVVSDLGADELRAFCGLLRERIEAS